MGLMIINDLKFEQNTYHYQIDAVLSKGQINRTFSSFMHIDEVEDVSGL